MSPGGEEVCDAVRRLFLFIGADPNPGWLEGCGMARDDKEFLVTGQAGVKLGLQTSIPGVFAIGDVRAGSVKRVAAAVGEGAAAVTQVHAYLAGVWKTGDGQSVPGAGEEPNEGYQGEERVRRLHFEKKKQKIIIMLSRASKECHQY